jgi:hypothetical protein
MTALSQRTHVPPVADRELGRAELDSAHCPEFVPVRLGNFLLRLAANGGQECRRRLHYACTPGASADVNRWEVAPARTALRRDRARRGRAGERAGGYSGRAGRVCGRAVCAQGGARGSECAEHGEVEGLRESARAVT